MDYVLELPFTDNIFDNRLLSIQDDLKNASPEQVLALLGALSLHLSEMDESLEIEQAYSRVHEAVYWFCDYLQQNGYDIE